MGRHDCPQGEVAIRLHIFRQPDPVPLIHRNGDVGVGFGPAVPGKVLAAIRHARQQQAVAQVVAFLKQKLPAPIASQIDSVLGGSGPADLSKSLGGLFGKK